MSEWVALFNPAYVSLSARVLMDVEKNYPAWNAVLPGSPTLLETLTLVSLEIMLGQNYSSVQHNNV